MLFVLLVLRARGKAQAQDLEAGGVVSLTCAGCQCEGTSDDGTSIWVFDNPSSGERVSSGAHRVQLFLGRNKNVTYCT